MRRRSSVLLVFALMASLLPGLAIPAAAVPADGDIFISEFHYDNASTDVGEFVEVTAPAGSDLTGWSVVLYNGSNNETYNTQALSGTVADQSAGYGTLTLDVVLQNGAPDGIALVDTTGTLVEFLSYEGTMTAVGGPADGATSTDVGVSQGSSTPVGASIERIGEVPDQYVWVADDDASKGAPNPGSTIDGTLIPEPDGGTDPEPEDLCDTPAEELTAIHAVQGSGDTSPMVGQDVVVEGVVVGDFQNNDQPDSGDFNGFFVQSLDPDDDPATSEGVFVYGPGLDDVSVGDVVRVDGTVGEFRGSTQIGGVSRAEVCGTGDLPAATEILLPLESVSDYERYEGMYVTFPQDLVISEYYNYDRFGEIVLALPFGDLDRQYTPTSVVEPGAEANELDEASRLRRITLDDGSTAQNPTYNRHPNGDEFALDNRFRGGDTVTNTTGILAYSFGAWKVQPTEGADHTATNPRPTEPEDVGGDLTVASFNVLNYFLTVDAGPDVCGAGADMDCRGADTQEEFERQRAKILAALTAIEADVFGLIEMENTPGVEPAADLVAGLNAEFGAGTYDYIDTGVVGTDAIRNGFVYDTTTVRPVGDFAILDSSVDPRFDDQRSRPVIAQTFEEIATGERFTVAVNHLKSKGSPCPEAPNEGDGQGNCSDVRLAAAEAMVDWLATDPTGSGDEDVLIIGDLNAYDHEDPIDAIIGGPDDELGTADDYVDLIREFIDEFEYSYVFDGFVGYLDYALANAPMLDQVTGTTVWHINADEPDILDYDTSYKSDAQDALYAPDAFRSSDHDPVIVGLSLGAEPDWPTTKDACKDGGWREFDEAGFRNQGQCVAFVASDRKAGGTRSGR
jgi:predicted extracellular nuclease